MADGVHSTLDGFVIEGSRLRRDFTRPAYQRRTVKSSPRFRPLISDINGPRQTVSNKWVADNSDINSRINDLPKHESKLNWQVPMSNNIVTSYQTSLVSKSVAQHKKHKLNPIVGLTHNLIRKSKLQLALISLAVIILMTGSYVSLKAIQTNGVAQAAADKLTHQANQAATHGSGSTTSYATQALSTVKPSTAAITSYAVAPNLPKYLKIPAIGVDARVLQVGILASGALGTPDNVYDTAWYKGSAQPGQPGATLIDGHVSSWTAHGVFYNLHNLKAGDTIQIVKGDNTVINYQVVKTQVYSSNNVNMQAAITPITPGVSGLNLITCTGQVIKGTSQFNERVIVFAQEV